MVKLVAAASPTVRLGRESARAEPESGVVVVLERAASGVPVGARHDTDHWPPPREAGDTWAVGEARPSELGTVGQKSQAGRGASCTSAHDAAMIWERIHCEPWLLQSRDFEESERAKPSWGGRGPNLQRFVRFPWALSLGA